MQQTEIIDVLLLNSPLYGTGSLCVLMRRPWMGGKMRREGRVGGEVESVSKDERSEKIEKE